MTCLDQPGVIHMILNYMDFLGARYCDMEVSTHYISALSILKTWNKVRRLDYGIIDSFRLVAAKN